MSKTEKDRVLLREFKTAAQIIASLKRQDADLGMTLAEPRANRAYAWWANATLATMNRRKRESRRALAHSLACAWGL